MIRDKQPRSQQATADMGQYSIESGRQSIEDQYEKLQRERKTIVDRKQYLQGLLANKKLVYSDRNGRVSRNVNQDRADIVHEIHEIDKRLTKLKPTLHTLNQVHEPRQLDYLKEIRDLLKAILHSMESSPNKQERKEV